MSKLVRTIRVYEAAVVDARAEVILQLIVERDSTYFPSGRFSMRKSATNRLGPHASLRLSVRLPPSQRRNLREVFGDLPTRMLIAIDTKTRTAASVTVEPIAGGQRTFLTLASEFHRSPGLLGWIEGRIAPWLTRRRYRRELASFGRSAQPLATEQVRVHRFVA